MKAKSGKKYAKVLEKECVACGSCIKVCPRTAISIPNGISAKIDKELCIGCGICKKTCPASVIDIISVLKDEEESQHE